jgi:hypothetical protein
MVFPCITGEKSCNVIDSIAKKIIGKTVSSNQLENLADSGLERANVN